MGKEKRKYRRREKSRRRRKSPEIQELTPEGAVPDGGDSEESDPGRFVINRAEPLTAEETEMTGTERSAEEGVPDAMQMPSDPQEIPARRNRKNTKENAQAVAAETASVEQSVRAMEEQPQKIYRIPPMNLLVKGKKGRWRFRCTSACHSIKAGADTSELWSRGSCHQCKLWSVCDPI